ncbi:MAG: hypothetical protein LUQ35_07155 [Methanoregula sp.]|nr:hypothetical protein [Methanoregula sp.]
MISLTAMAEENPQPQNTGESSQAPPQQQTGQQPRTPQGQGSGQRRNDRRDRPRHHGGRRDHHRRDPQQPIRPAAPEKPADPSAKDQDNDDEEEPGRDRPSSHGRHHRGGRPPKRVIEEWVNDPYCE